MKKYGLMILFVLVFVLLIYLIYSQQQLTDQMAELKEDVDTRLRVMEAEVNSMESEVGGWQKDLLELQNQLNARMADVEQKVS